MVYIRTLKRFHMENKTSEFHNQHKKELKLNVTHTNYIIIILLYIILFGVW